MAPVTHHTIHVNGIKIHYVESGEGSPLVLLHGFPETWYCWRHQIPVLAEKFRVIVPDLRGYGETEKPASGYDKRTMANDIRALLQHSEIEKVSMVGHDRGARVATRFAKDHPAMLDRLVVMGNIPTRIIFQRMNAEVARGHSFFIFNNVPDLPEALISGREEIWLRYIFFSWCYNPHLFSGEENDGICAGLFSAWSLRGALTITELVLKTSFRMRMMKEF
jgi:haloacetate dehalogenase